MIAHRLNIALSLRETRFDVPCYRLVFGDSDGMPGLVIDRFDQDFVVQISIAGMEMLKDDILAVLEKKAQTTFGVVQKRWQDARVRRSRELCRAGYR